MDLKRLATFTEPARIRALAAAIVALAAALGLVLPFDLPGIAEAAIGVLAVLIPLIQGEVTRAAVVSPATNAAEVNAALDANPAAVIKHNVTPQTPGKADHAAPEV